jgi:hypothetical protein
MRIDRSDTPETEGDASFAAIVPELESLSGLAALFTAGLEGALTTEVCWTFEASTAARTSMVDRSDALESAVDLLFTDASAGGVDSSVIFAAMPTGDVTEVVMDGSDVWIFPFKVAANKDVG